MNITRKKIVIAEDDSTIRNLYKGELEKGGYIVQTASDGEEAVDLISQVKPDLVILDVMMPKKSGLDVLVEMKQNIDLSAIPVFILSVLGDPDDKAKGLSLGAEKYIAKAETIPGKVIQEVNDFFAAKDEKSNAVN